MKLKVIFIKDRVQAWECQFAAAIDGTIRPNAPSVLKTETDDAYRVVGSGFSFLFRKLELTPVLHHRVHAD